MTAGAEAIAMRAVLMNWQVFAAGNITAACEAVELARDPGYRIKDPAILKALAAVHLVGQDGRMCELVREVILRA